MLDLMTDPALRVIFLTADEAQSFSDKTMTEQHLLLALIREGKGVAARALASFGVTLESAQKLYFEQTYPGASNVLVAPSSDVESLPVKRSPELKTVLGRTLREACQMGHTYIGTEHLLLALINMKDGGNHATDMLVELNAPISEVRQKIIQLLTGYPPERQEHQVRP